MGPVPERITITDNRIKIRFSKPVTRSRSSSAVPDAKSVDCVDTANLDRHNSHPRNDNSHRNDTTNSHRNDTANSHVEVVDRIESLENVATTVVLEKRHHRERPRKFPRPDQAAPLPLPEASATTTLSSIHASKRNPSKRIRILSSSSSSSVKSAPSDTVWRPKHKFDIPQTQGDGNGRSIRGSRLTTAWGHALPDMKKMWLDYNDAHWIFLNSRGIY